MRLAYLILIVCAFFSCQNPPPETRADRIATNICSCATPLLNLNKAAANSTGSIDFEGIQAEFEKTRACIIDQHMKPEDQTEVQKALAGKCPELAGEAELMGELMGK